MRSWRSQELETFSETHTKVSQLMHIEHDRFQLTVRSETTSSVSSGLGLGLRLGFNSFQGFGYYCWQYKYKLFEAAAAKTLISGFQARWSNFVEKSIWSGSMSPLCRFDGRLIGFLLNPNLLGVCRAKFWLEWLNEAYGSCLIFNFTWLLDSFEDMHS